MPVEGGAGVGRTGVFRFEGNEMVGRLRDGRSVGEGFSVDFDGERSSMVNF
jgi:hypothetical protein